jgi:hypothetical protein
MLYVLDYIKPRFSRREVRDAVRADFSVNNSTNLSCIIGLHSDIRPIFSCTPRCSKRTFAMKFCNQSFCVTPFHLHVRLPPLTIESDTFLNPSSGGCCQAAAPCWGTILKTEQVPSDGRRLRGKRLRVPHPRPWSTILLYWKNSSTPSSVHTTIHTVCQLVIGSSSAHKWFHSASGCIRQHT